MGNPAPPPSHSCNADLSDVPAAGEPQGTLVDAAKTIYHRYAREIVEALQLCPWAKTARLSGQVALEVICDDNPEPPHIAQRMAALAAQEQTIIALIIFPRVVLDPLSFRHLTARVRAAADQLRADRGCRWAVADFHPAGAVDLSSPERAVSLIRRSPDPTLQLVRLQVLHELRAELGEGKRFVDPDTLTLQDLNNMQATQPLHDRVAERNHRRLLTLGVDDLLARLEGIAADRRARYAQFGVPSAPWDPPLGPPAGQDSSIPAMDPNPGNDR